MLGLESEGKERFCFWVGANSPSDNRAIQRET
jgi:hypothetical protein